MRRKTRARIDLQISEFDLHRLQKAIIDGSIFRGDRAEHGIGWHNLRSLVTGHFFECFDRYCRHDDAESQRALWAEFREDILKAAEKYSPNEKPWGCRFDEDAQ